MKFEITGVHDSGKVKRAFLALECGRDCKIPLRHGVANATVWGWDGKETVSPSVNCSVCGFHKTLVNGVWT